ncbi:MAG: thioredoxin domain-containing protein [Alphaproteobacteria bacterium]|nr:thioredoxin domain-containing protein [Alphaproteobacteria bacterium]
MKIVNRISKIFAMVAIYIFSAYTYLTAKGFIFDGNTPVLSNQAMAKTEFSQKIKGEVMLSQTLNRGEGDIKAPITMYAFSSMMCSHCGDFHKNTYPKLKRQFVDTGKLRFIFIHLPTDVLSMQAAKLSYCMPEEKYYDFIEELYTKKDWRFAKDDRKLNEYAKKMGLTDSDIQKCKDNKKLTSDILLVRENAITSLGIQATPTFIIDSKDGKELISGGKRYSDFAEYITKKLGEK